MVMDKSEKKARIEKYKQRKQVGGVYSITNRATGKRHVFSACDLQGAKNRFDFMQFTDSPGLSFADEWKQYGGGAFAFEILEEIEKTDQTQKEFLADVQALHEIWNEKQGE